LIKNQTKKSFYERLFRKQRTGKNKKNLPTYGEFGKKLQAAALPLQTLILFSSK